MKNTYLHRLIDRATSNPLFENNRIGNYVIEPQHGPNVYVYNIYKHTAKRKEHVYTVNIDAYTGSIFIQNEYSTRKQENQSLINFFLNTYQGKPLVFKEYIN